MERSRTPSSQVKLPGAKDLNSAVILQAWIWEVFLVEHLQNVILLLLLATQQLLASQQLFSEHLLYARDCWAHLGMHW
jgi:hypothetical protein